MTTVEPIRNKSDIKKVENILANQSKRDLLLFEIGINCGLRISDILRLNVGDVRNRTHIQITEQKTGKFKKFPINSKLKPMIDDFMLMLKKYRTFISFCLESQVRQNNIILHYKAGMRKGRS